MEQTADHLAAGVKARHRLPVARHHLALLVDLETAKGKGDAAGHRPAKIRRLVELLRPVGFRRLDALGAMTVEHRRIERTATAGRRVVRIQRLHCLLLVDLQLIDQTFERIRAERFARTVARLEQVEHLAVEDLVGQTLRLLQDHAAVFGIGI